MSRVVFGSILVFALLGCTDERQAPPPVAGPPVTLERAVGTFDTVALEAPFEVTVTSGTGPVVVDAPSGWAERVSVTVRDGRLVLAFDPPVTRGAVPRIRVTVPGDAVRALEVSGSGSVRATTPLRGPELAIALSGSGDIDATIEGERLEVASDGSGRVAVAGRATTLSATVSGSGAIDARALAARNADASITGSGDIDVRVTERLSCQITGSGDLRYHGAPSAPVRCATAGSGSARPAGS